MNYADLRYYKPRSNVFFLPRPCVRLRARQLNFTLRAICGIMYVPIMLLIDGSSRGLTATATSSTAFATFP